MNVGFARSAFSMVALALIAPTCGWAGAIKPAYDVLDLGQDLAHVSNPFTTSATVKASNTESTYAFPMTDHRVPDALGNRDIAVHPQTANYYDGLPELHVNRPFDPNATGSTAPQFFYRNYTGPIFQNANGIAAVAEVQGNYGHSYWSGSSVNLYRRQGDGSDAWKEIIFEGKNLGSPDNYSTSGHVAAVLGMNDLNQVLVRTAFRNGYGYSQPIYSIVDLDAGIQTDLASLLPQNFGYEAFGLDDQGRILVGGSFFDRSAPYQIAQRSYLLSPAGVVTEPLKTPEPATWALLVFAGCGVLIRRRAGHRRV